MYTLLIIIAGCKALKKVYVYNFVFKMDDVDADVQNSDVIINQIMLN